MKSRDPNLESLEKKVRALYQGPQGLNYHGVKRAVPTDAIPWIMERRARQFQRFIKPEDRVFEFGVGQGWNLGAIQCRQRVGYDVATDLAPQVESFGIEFAHEIPQAFHGTFDFVLCYHVLEHLLHPAEGLLELRNLVKPGGRCYIAVPFEKERSYRHFRTDEPNHHLFSWNVQTLGNLVELSGFEIQSIGLVRYGYDRIGSHLACRFRMGKIGYHLFRSLVYLLRPLLEVVVVASRDESNFG